jgi:hypothetical protein
MTLIGPEVTISPLLAKIQESYAEKNFKQVEDLVKSATDQRDAQAMYDLVFRTVRANCWIAFLKNPNLNHVIWHRPLVDIISRLETRLKLGDKTVTHNSNLILLHIVRNEQWCRTLSYRYFIDLVPLSKPLAIYMVSRPEFLLHLHYPHFSLLIAKLPSQAIKMLETLDEMILHEEEETDRVIAILKWLLVNDKVARNILFLSPKFSDLLEQLFLEFEDDKFFALEVLKQSELCHRWLKTEDAYQHPLLTIHDYQELACHYLLTPLSMQYITLASSLLNQEFNAVVDGLATMRIEDVKSPSLSYTPANEAFSINQQQTSPVLMEKTKRKKKK